ncbi:MAG: uridine kinase [Deltaproteobacteria bacterium]|nr:MAG: uridine kinase [Deltaproteobacteria bacterium]TMQ24475.1 MAG: uridine kinase [Deltaproteobacteria bacterium]
MSARPYIVGIAGGTGSGKTTVALKLAGAMPAGRCITLEHDAYYRDQGHLSPEVRAELNYDHPAALESSLLSHHLRELRAGHAVEVPIYDFTTHTRRRETRTVEPAPVIIVEGILVFTDAALRELMDIKIFVDTDPDIRLMRRIRRDLEQRGRTFQSVRDQYYATVRPMHLEFVEPTKRWADLIIPEGGDNRVAIDVLLGQLWRVVNEQ